MSVRIQSIIRRRYVNDNELLIGLLAATVAVLVERLIAKEKESKKQQIMKPIEMTFGQAIEALKKGLRVRRSGWNGKGMYLFLVKQSLATGAPGSSGVSAGCPDVFVFEPAICMYTAQGKNQIGWLASQADMLGEDWEIVPEDNEKAEAQGGAAV